MQTPQQFGSASSYAKKYALGNLLLIDDTQDSDATNNHGKKPVSKVISKQKLTQLHARDQEIILFVSYKYSLRNSLVNSKSDLAI